MQSECLFCKIIRKEIPAVIIYENDHVIAFPSIEPINPGHALIVPKTHSQNIYETPDEHLAELIVASKKIATAVKSVFNAEGVNIINNNDKSAGQSIFHTHFHIIPRFHDDGHQEWHGNQISIDELKVIGEKIKVALTK
jgi:histidine triad (HIT) family protein